jgi:isopentenyl diphosphate isomerase/L-lactate dehydrogenase-like FMN-dependent dehydrogenase
VGLQYPLLVDGGFRSGGDIATAIALGADFVLLGRPFMFGMAALGRLGAEHVMELLREELLNAMYQLGCTTVSRLPDFLSVVSPPSD